MFIAYNAAHERITIDHADSSEKYYCPICDTELRVKNKGTIKKHHFAHITKCTDTWTNDMSDWHINWQERFPVETREVVVEKDGVKHRADVLIGNTVIEFQHSKISKEEFNERNSFYAGLGYNVVWVFDMIDEYNNEKIVGYDSFTWKYHWHTFDDYIAPNYAENKVKIFFQMKENKYKLDHEDSFKLYHVNRFFNYNQFKIITDDEVFYYLPDIIEIFPYSISEIQDRLQWSFETDCYYPCFMNLSYAFWNKCEACLYSTRCQSDSALAAGFRDYCSGKFSSIDTTGCLFRFKDILDGWDMNMDRVVEIKKTREGLVSYLKVSKGGQIIEKHFENNLKAEITPPGSTLLELLKRSKGKVIIALNLETGVKVKVGNSDYFKNNRISRIWGYIGRGGYDGFSSERTEIKDWDRPSWKLEWER